MSFGLINVSICLDPVSTIVFLGAVLIIAYFIDRGGEDGQAAQVA